MRQAHLLFLLVVGVALATSGCFLDRSGLAGQADGSTPRDGGDSGVSPRDAEIEPDATACVVVGPEICNERDDDCDPATPDGADDPRFESPCDDPLDPDRCNLGRVLCVEGVMLCTGDVASEAELCDGADNDCDEATVDGSGDLRVGAACLAPGSLDMCADGIGVCEGGAFRCDDSAAPDTRELCDGVDNDCDGSTLDGSGDPRVGAACVGPGGDDMCADGIGFCQAGVVRCDDSAAPDTRDFCDGVDNDCDPSTPDGAAEPTVGRPCDGTADADTCEDGTFVCAGAAGVICDDTSASPSETCNALDDDCDGTIDEGACECDVRVRGSRPYLVCGEYGDRRSWVDARDYCRNRGYELVTIDDVAEQEWVRSTARAIRADRSWWIGANDRDTEGTFTWVGTSAPVTYANWRAGEPNELAGEDCAELQTENAGASGTVGGWNDLPCGSQNRFVCERRP